jgi:transposase
MRKHRSYPVEFKRQVAQEYLAGETLHGLAKRYEINRNLVRIWVAKYEAGSFDSDVVAAEMVQTQQARIAALERLVGKLVLENEFLKGASRDAARPRSETTSVVAGPVASRSLKDAG